ncbi:MAG: FAS1-like dehydratase domain-containing protein, partial [Geminicoccales bacterium]
METDLAHLRPWLGRTEQAYDRIVLERVLALQATLERPEKPLREGDALPSLWHWLFFWEIAPHSGLGRDGHPALGGSLPALGRARRMWAGSRLQFHRPLRIGEPIERRSTIADIDLKTGRSGPLACVTVRHEISTRDGLALTDEHDIVYREDTGVPPSERPGEPAPDDAAFFERKAADAVLLFRYSALTFNGHRIHYDREYAIDVEGYSGLVVHGPLLATLLVDLAERAWPERQIARFEFRGRSPMVAGQPFTVNGR